MSHVRQNAVQLHRLFIASSWHFLYGDSICPSSASGQRLRNEFSKIAQEAYLSCEGISEIRGRARLALERGS